MKNLPAFLFLAFSLFAMSCSKSELDTEIQGKWHVLNMSGGFAGINCSYNFGEYVWTFEDGSLTREANLNSLNLSCIINITSDQIDFETTTQDDKDFLKLNNNYLGEIVFSSDTLTINTNNTPTGNGADGFLFILVKD